MTPHQPEKPSGEAPAPRPYRKIGESMGLSGNLIVTGSQQSLETWQRAFTAARETAIAMEEERDKACAEAEALEQQIAALTTCAVCDLRWSGPWTDCPGCQAIAGMRAIADQAQLRDKVELIEEMIAEREQQEQQEQQLAALTADREAISQRASEAFAEVSNALQTVYDTFRRDEAQGYRSRDRQFAIEVLGRVLPSPILPQPGDPFTADRVEPTYTIKPEVN